MKKQKENPFGNQSFGSYGQNFNGVNMPNGGWPTPPSFNALQHKSIQYFEDEKPRSRGQFSPNFGVLQYAISDLQKHAISAPPNVQQYINTAVNNSQFGQPFDISLYRNFQLGSGKTIGDIVPQLANVNTALQGRKFLGASLIQPLLQNAAYLSKEFGQDFSETFQNLYVGALESLDQFSPGRGTSLINYSMRSAFNYNRKVMREEAQFHAGPSVEFLQGIGASEIHRGSPISDVGNWDELPLNPQMGPGYSTPLPQSPGGDYLVGNVHSNSPAGRAGILPGERIVGLQKKFDLAREHGGLDARAYLATIADYAENGNPFPLRVEGEHGIREVMINPQLRTPKILPSQTSGQDEFLASVANNISSTGLIGEKYDLGLFTNPNYRKRLYTTKNGQTRLIPFRRQPEPGYNVPVRVSAYDITDLASRKAISGEENYQIFHQAISELNNDLLGLNVSRPQARNVNYSRDISQDDIEYQIPDNKRVSIQDLSEFDPTITEWDAMMSEREYAPMEPDGLEGGYVPGPSTNPKKIDKRYAEVVDRASKDQTVSGNFIVGASKTGWRGEAANITTYMSEKQKELGDELFDKTMRIGHRGPVDKITIEQRRKWIDYKLRDLESKNPASAARLKYTGISYTDKEGHKRFQENAQAFSEAYGVDLNYDPDDPIAFGEKYEAFRKENPGAAELFDYMLEVPNEQAVYENLKKVYPRENEIGYLNHMQKLEANQKAEAMASSVKIRSRSENRTGGINYLGGSEIDPFNDEGRFGARIHSFGDGSDFASRAARSASSAPREFPKIENPPYINPDLAYTRPGESYLPKSMEERGYSRSDLLEPIVDKRTGDYRYYQKSNGEEWSGEVQTAYHQTDDGEGGYMQVASHYRATPEDAQEKINHKIANANRLGLEARRMIGGRHSGPDWDREAVGWGPKYASNIKSGDIADYVDLVYGKGDVEYLYDDNSKNYVNKGHLVRGWRGNTVLDEAGVGRAVSWSQDALGQSTTTGYLPTRPDEMIATIDKRLNTFLKERADQFVDAAKRQGVSPAEAKQLAEVTKSVANTLVRSQVEQMAKDMGLSDTEYKKAKTMSMHSRVLSTPDEIRETMDAFEGFRARVDETGMTPEQLASFGKRQAFVMSADINGEQMGFQFGYGDGFKGNTPFGNSGFNKALYGAYVMKRIWNMSAGPVIQQSDAYMKYAAEAGQISGIGSGLLGVEGQQLARASIAENYGQRTANQVVGGFRDLGFFASQTSDGFGRMAAYTKMGAGVAGIAGLASNFLPFVENLSLMGMTIPQIGMVAGGSVIGTGAALETINGIGGMFGKNPNLSMGKAATDASVLLTGLKGWARASSKQGWYGTDDRAGAIWDEFSNAEKAFIQNYNSRSDIDRIGNLAEGLAAQTGVEKGQALSAIRGIEQYYGQMSDERAFSFGHSAVSSGLTLDQFTNAAINYAGSGGAVVRSTAFAKRFDAYSYASTQERQQLDAVAAQKAQYASQLQSLTPIGTSTDFGKFVVEAAGIKTQAQASAATSLIQTSQQFGSTSEREFSELARLSAGQSPAYNQAIASAMRTGGMVGMSTSGIATAMASQNWTPQGADVFARAMGGDLSALSYFSQQHDLPFQFHDARGRSINTTSGAGAIGTMDTMGFWGMSTPGEIFGGATTDFDKAAAMLGSDNPDLINAYLEGGERGTSSYFKERSYSNQMASIGIQAQGIALQEQYLWGGGSWNAPAPGSMWYMQDQMTSMQYQSQQLDFASQGKRMGMSNQFAIQREDNQLARMNASQAYQDYTWSSNYNSFQRNMGWAREDWVYNDEKSQLQFGWQMEDLNENIRFSSGRQRKSLLKQRERTTLLHSIDEEQLDKTRDRQEEVWASQDENYRKQKEYQEELARLDKQSFDLNKNQREEFYKMDVSEFERKKKEYEEQFELQRQMEELQRKHQKDQLELQKASLGVQAQSAELQKEMATTQENLSKHWGDFLTELNYLVQNKGAATLFGQLIHLLDTANKIDAVKVLTIDELLQRNFTTSVSFGRSMNE